MRRFYELRSLLFTGLVAAALVSVPSLSQASFIVLEGWDLFTTETGPDLINGGLSEILGVPLEGVAILNYDFGGAIGVQNVGQTDTIVRRLEDAIVAGPGDTDTIDIELVALQLKTVNQVDFGLGLDFYYITLAAVSMGTMDITFLDMTGGTANSSLNVDFDLRKGGLAGPIVGGLPPILPLLNNNNREWGRIPPPFAVKIADVNFLLNGLDTSEDFWFKTSAADGCIVHGSELVDTSHCIRVSVPEPGSGLLVGLGLAGLVGFGARRLT